MRHFIIYRKSKAPVTKLLHLQSSFGNTVIMKNQHPIDILEPKALKYLLTYRFLTFTIDTGPLIYIYGTIQIRLISIP